MNERQVDRNATMPFTYDVKRTYASRSSSSKFGKRFSDPKLDVLNGRDQKIDQNLDEVSTAMDDLNVLAKDMKEEVTICIYSRYLVSNMSVTEQDSIQST